MKIKMLANFSAMNTYVILLTEFLTLIKYLFLGINEAQKVADIRNLFYNDNLKKFMLNETDGLWIKKHKFEQV